MEQRYQELQLIWRRRCQGSRPRRPGCWRAGVLFGWASGAATTVARCQSDDAGVGYPRARFRAAGLRFLEAGESVRKLEQAGDWPADGLDYHVCFGSEGKLRVSEIWDSREQLDAFGERLMLVLANVGIEPGEPELVEIHNIVRR